MDTFIFNHESVHFLFKLYAYQLVHYDYLNYMLEH